ncbi:(2Fe-2S)-binding protein [Actinomadura barringtoniae]|uniref:(2Fe-2S)-binding protein n=1 Tax=Actinomadura barringtoniae TaxID=1427535 RepID=A0A939T6G3_9ACTN|nr:(2Fe-2S)-binding protein [Actinomadura barringtoniae]MBO2454896.1 (2Fe-2S)-binding protein [Actinomadura barringtoniae]
MAGAVHCLAEAAALGPFFEIVTDPAEECDPTWRPLPENDPDRLLGLIDSYAERLGTGERRVAASILFQGLASRLWSPVVVAAALGVVPDLSSLHWRWAPGAPIALWLAEPSALSGSAAEAVHATVVEGQLRPLRAAMLEAVRLADGLIWGNAASALVGALYAGRLRSDLAPRLNALVRDLLAREPFIDSGSFDAQGAFVRRSCCLYYKVPPGGGMCGDCALLPRP